MPDFTPDDMSGVRLHLVTELEDLFALKRWLGERRPVLGVDTETSGLDWWRDSLRTVQLGDAMTGWCIPVERAGWGGAVNEMLRAYDGPIVMHNSSFDIQFLETNGIYPRRENLQDSLAQAQLINSRARNGLKSLANRLVHPRSSAGDVMLKAAMRESGWTWRTVPINFPGYWAYSALDPVLTARVYEKQKPEVDALYREAYELEIAVILVLVDMARRGVRIDLDYCRGMSAKVEPYLRDMSGWIKHEFGLANPGSDAQVVKALNGYGLTWTKLTKKGHVACDKEVLQSLDHPLATAILQYRDSSKLLNTYLKNFIEYADSDGYLHANIRASGARTGRGSISRPSMQNLPRNQHPRNAIIPRPGNVLTPLDYDQIEMRLFAHFAGEESMITAIEYGDQMRAAGHDGFDVHSMNARAVYGLGVGQPVPKKQRTVMKNGSFSIIYGAGIEQFARTAKIGVDEASAFLAKYKSTYPGIERFTNAVSTVAYHRANTEGYPYIIEPSGRRHRCDRDEVYKLINYEVQGTAAWCFKRKLVEADAAGLGDYLVLPVHDEILCDVPKEEADEYLPALQKVMEDRTTFRVPLTVGVERYDRWGDKYLDADEEPWYPPDTVDDDAPDWSAA